MQRTEALISTSKPTRHAAILDAGSSGTRLYIYRWQEWAGMACVSGTADCPGPNKCNSQDPCDDEPCQKSHCHRNAPPPKIHAVYQWKKSGGLARVGAGNVASYLDDLLDRARLYLGDDVVRAKTPLFVLGTAGIRDLDSRRKKMLQKEIVRYIKKSGFKVNLEAGDCGEISGEDEALYGWLAANYLREHFTAGVESRGYLEMGGASAQIAFWPMQKEVQWDEGKFGGELRKMRIKGQDYYVFTKSHGLGADKAWRHHQAQLLTTIDPVVQDPCLPSGCSWSTEDKIIKGTRTVEGALMAAVMDAIANPDSPIFIKDRAVRRMARNISATISKMVARLIVEYINEGIDGEEDTTPETIGHEIAKKTMATQETTDAITENTPDKESEDWLFGVISDAVGDAAAAMIERRDPDLNKSKYKRCEETTLQMLHYLSKTGNISSAYPFRTPNVKYDPVNLLPDGPRIAYGDHKFLAGAQFWYTTREIFGLNAEGEPMTTKYNYHEFREEVENLSQMDWEDIKSEMTSVREEFLKRALFLAAWITNVLKAYGFELNGESDSESGPALEPFNGPSENSEGELTWTLGKILLHSIDCKPEVVNAKDIDLEEFPIKQC